MKSQIAILGCGPTGIQTAVYLLEQYYTEILIFDTDVDYAKGMALDCMQASTVRGWQGSLVAVDCVQDLAKAKLLIVAENNHRALDEDWIKASRDARCTIFASTLNYAIKAAITEGVSNTSILGVQGMVDARMLAEAVAAELDISAEDVHAMVHGGVGTKMNSSPDLVRVNGIPVNLITEGTYEKALDRVLSAMPYKDEPWAPHYTIAAAAVELALIMESGQQTILPITRADGTEPCLVGNYDIQQSYAELV